MTKLRDAGHVRELGPAEELTPDELQRWYILYHVVHSGTSGTHSEAPVLTAYHIWTTQGQGN